MKFPNTLEIVIRYYDYCIYHLTGKSSERRGFFPERADHRVYLSRSVRMERDRIAGRDGQLYRASRFAHRYVCDVFESVFETRKRNYLKTFFFLITAITTTAIMQISEKSQNNLLITTVLLRRTFHTGSGTKSIVCTKHILLCTSI